MKNKVLFVNHKEKNCGVYQYGQRLANILCEEKRYDVDYIEINDYDSFKNKIEKNNYKHIIFNWHILTTNWLTTQNIQEIKIPISCIYHDGPYPYDLNPHSIFMTDMTTDISNKKYKLSRPIVLEFEKIEKEKKEINIGSFGFGLPRKRFDLVCNKVKNEFEKANINLHITTAKVVDSSGYYSSCAIQSCVKALENTEIKLNITTNIISEKELAIFLRKNDINIFMYDNGDSNGLSSVIDHVIGAEAVFAVNSANMFSHVTSIFPELNIDNNSIIDIIKLGNAPAKKLKEIWNNDVIRNQIYEVIYGNNW